MREFDGGAGPCGRPVRLLLVDDSPVIRRLIRHALTPFPQIVIVGEAGSAAEAREQIRLLSPDVLTLDVEMPGVSGLEFLAKLMQMRPMPVVMVSAETHRGSAAAIAALSLGAVDCIGKPAGSTDASTFLRLAEAVVTAASARVDRRAAAPATPDLSLAGGLRWNGRTVLIGASTGGVDALERVLATFPPDCPPTVIVQHMPESFLSSFAQRLDQVMAPRVRLAADGAVLHQGDVVLAPGGDHHLTLSGTVSTICRLQPGARRNGHRPSVDVTFDSARPMAQSVVAALLTGMGRDGAEGMLALRQAGARTLAQDEDSAVVWGMPRAAWENGGAEELVPLDRIGPHLLALCTRTPRTAGAGVTAGSVQ